MQQICFCKARVMSESVFKYLTMENVSENGLIIKMKIIRVLYSKYEDVQVRLYNIDIKKRRKENFYD